MGCGWREVSGDAAWCPSIDPQSAVSVKLSRIAAHTGPDALPHRTIALTPRIRIRVRGEHTLRKYSSHRGRLMLFARVNIDNVIYVSFHVGHFYLEHCPSNI